MALPRGARCVLGGWSPLVQTSDAALLWAFFFLLGAVALVLSHEVRNASAVSFHESRRAQRARNSM